MRLRFYLSKCQRSKIVNKWNFWSVGNQHTLILIQLQGRTIWKHLSKFHAHIQSFHLHKLILQIMHMTHAKTSVQGQSLKDYVCVCTQSCPIFATPWTIACQATLSMILQARILEWVTISFSRGSSQPRDQTQVSHIGGRWFNL